MEATACSPDFYPQDRMVLMMLLAIISTTSSNLHGRGCLLTRRQGEAQPPRRSAQASAAKSAAMESSSGRAVHSPSHMTDTTIGTDDTHFRDSVSSVTEAR